MIGLILLGVIAAIGFWVMGIYNNLVRLNNKVKNAWGQIDVQLQRRYDLIPNLVETVKGYMGHERGTLNEVIEARNQAQYARDQISSQGGPTENSLKGLMAAETMLKGSIGKIFALAENYPDLKASTTMQQLQDELANTENKVGFARENYNNQVMTFNTAQEVFPANFIAQTFGFHTADLFEVEETKVKEAVKVEF